MSARVVVAGLLVGLLGIATLFAAHGVEHLFFKRVAQFMAEHPEAFPRSPNQATLWTAVVTLWVGLLFGILYHLARPAAGPEGAIRLALVCWLGFVVPGQVLMFLWSHTSLAALATTAAGYLLQLVLGGLVLARLLKAAPETGSVSP